jgi:hypothetical protein
VSVGVETAVTFRAGRNELFGIVHVPPAAADLGIVMLVGGPQYRVGSHRERRRRPTTRRRIRVWRLRSC